MNTTSLHRCSSIIVDVCVVKDIFKYYLVHLSLDILLSKEKTVLELTALSPPPSKAAAFFVIAEYLTVTAIIKE